ncbi:dolichyl pyrophosphate phosphatase [Ophiostoma piceae UAMH 11346]|uniref:Dolichyldiphosphatase n=1 Tax=Ophiostoma piceae (strain UAMH 11346) TaxID=1262450 RepID=S3BRB4_OPHP1|nr:dolichyl pyrophosphate phosphatase [Ophiostoma piceae UAMH 11346]
MDDDSIQLTSLSLTHVYYDPDDPISYISAWLALVPQALIVVYVTLAWSTREAEVILAFAGQLGCEAVNFVLKRIIKEERPQHHYRGNLLASLFGGLSDDKPSGEAAAAAAGAATAGLEANTAMVNGHRLPFRRGYGMPSSHAQFAGYWALTIALFLLVRYQKTQNTQKTQKTQKTQGAKKTTSSAATRRDTLTLTQRVGISVVAFVVAFLIAGSRVYLHYHTPKQVTVGFVAGLVVGAGWFAATAVVRQLGLLDWALSLPLAQYLRLRDLALEEDVLQAGWEKWEVRQAEKAALEAAKNK